MALFKVVGNGVEVNLDTADIELLLECLSERKDNLSYEGLDKDELFDREDKIVQLSESLIDLIGDAGEPVTITKSDGFYCGE